MIDVDPEIPLEGFAFVADGLDHPECVATGPDGVLYAGGEAGQIYRIDDGDVHLIASTGGFILGLCLDADSNVYACDLRRHEVIRVTPSGEMSRYGEPIPVPNYPVFTDDGHLFVSDSGPRWGGDGRLMRIAPDGTTAAMDVDVRAFPNGLAISPDGRWLYLVLTTLPGVVRMRLDGHDVVGEPETIVELAQHVPDGLAFDAEGRLLISCYAPDVVYRWDGDSLVTLATDPLHTTIASPTNLAFFGPDRGRLALASLGRWHILGTDRAGAGAPLRYPSLAR